MAVVTAEHFVPAPRIDRSSVDLFLAKRWVLATFDQAMRTARLDLQALSRLHRVACDRAERIANGEESALPLSDPHASWQLRRLCRLAPQAVDWLSRHHDDAGEDGCWQFRDHLDHRCDAIISERPHPCANDE